nr:ribonuclease H-like domain-containing protein [Tanacetum cinerariifolium]
MSTQQDIYAAGSESRPPMLNKENYVPWSSRLLRYAKSRPNGKLIHNSILNGPYVRRMIAEPGDGEHSTTAMNMALTLMLNYSTPTNNNQRISSNPRNRQIAQPGMNMVQDRQMQMVGGNGGNQFRQYTGHNAGNLNGYNAVQNVGNQRISSNPKNRQIAQLGMNMSQDRQMQMIGGNGGNQFRQYAGQNAGNLNRYNDVQNVENQNQIGNGNLVAAHAEGNAAGPNGNKIRCYNCRGFADLDEIEEVNANCILMANLQQASPSGTQTDSAPVYDSDGSAE